MIIVFFSSSGLQEMMLLVVSDSLKAFSDTHRHSEPNPSALCVFVSAAAGLYAGRHTHLSGRKDCKSHTWWFTIKNACDVPWYRNDDQSYFLIKQFRYCDEAFYTPHTYNISLKKLFYLKGKLSFFCLSVYLSLCVLPSSDRFSLQAHGKLSVLRCVLVSFTETRNACWSKPEPRD